MRQIVMSLFVVAMASSPVGAQTPNDVPADVKRITMTTGFDVLTAYVFRGIPQESEGFVAQPPLDVGVAFGKGITASFGNWYSLHSGPTGHFYEADLYGSLTFTAGRIKPGVMFTSYSSPNDRFRTVNEIAAVVSIDDRGSRLPLSPKATIAHEISGQADGGANAGTYFELALRPSFTLIDSRYPIALAIPVRVGTSLKDYYEGAAGSDGFGFFSSGLVASVAIAKGRLTWDLHGGIDLLWLGTNMQALNGGNGFKPVGMIGWTLAY